MAGQVSGIHPPGICASLYCAHCGGLERRELEERRVDLIADGQALEPVFDQRSALGWLIRAVLYLLERDAP